MRALIIFSSTFLILFSCRKTPDPDYLPINLGDEKLEPWNAPIYTDVEMHALFPGTDYSSLSSVFVATTGNDESGDGTAANPYLSIEHAMEAHSEPGTIIRVKQGVYTEHVRVSSVGTQAQPYVLYSEDGPGAAILDGEAVNNALIKLVGKYNVVDGFEILNSTGYGIQIGKDKEGDEVTDRDSYSVIRNVKIHDVGRDIIKSGNINFQLVEGCEIYDCTNTVQWDNAIDGVAVYYTLCRRNYIHDISPGFAAYFKSGSHNNIWTENLFKDIGDPAEDAIGGAIQLGGSGSFSWRDDEWYDYPSGHAQYVYNNIFINCAGAAVTFTNCWSSKVYNNSMLNCGYASIGSEVTPVKALFRIRVTSSSNQASQDLEIFNNVAVNEAGFEIEKYFVDQGVPNTLGKILHGSNTIYNNGVNLDWNFPDGVLNGDVEEFFQYINDSLQVDIGSSVVNTGESNSLVLVDYLGVARPIGIIDRGAYEE